MNCVKFFGLVTRREFSERYLDFFRNHGIEKTFSELAYGTATDSILNFFGLEKTDMVKFNFMLTDKKTEEIFDALYNETELNGIGNGIAYTVPVDGLGGEVAKTYFLGNNDIDRKEDSEMDGLSKAVLIVVVVDKGNTDTVMEAARSVGASGGTVVRAKGTGANIAKFFGVSISEEKEMVYIVASRESRNDIMRAVAEKAGSDTNAHGVVFSLPVDKVAGIKNLED